AQAFIPNPDHKPEVNHLDGNKFNCYVGNLIWATSAENQQHAYDTGLNVAAQGTDRYGAKIKDENNIIYIRDNPDNLSRKELAEKFGVEDANRLDSTGQGVRERGRFHSRETKLRRNTVTNATPSAKLFARANRR
ncbi:MAG: HNH endonuclease, partial [Selenomonadaceae bacterium]|nr:HNH endonuclease [Selenomonadaceae bacterium]